MARYVEVTDGVVTNVMEASPDVAEQRNRQVWVASDIADVDDKYDGSSFIKPKPVLDTNPEQSMDQLRLARNHLLEQTDWWAVIDRKMTQAEKDYRQALRDLPQNQTPENTALTNIVWPTRP